MTRRDGQLAIGPVRGVDVAYWDPLRRTGLWGADVRISRAIGNFGDLLGPFVVGALVDAWGLPEATAPARMLTIGSVLHFARDGDIVWGSGLNAKTGAEVGSLSRPDLRAVRGPRTAESLSTRFGRTAPAAFGDPGLLLGALAPRLQPGPDEGRRAVSVVPNLNELATIPSRENVVNPRWPLRRVLRRLAESRLVVGSSLHGVIVAESLGIPARAVRSGVESAFKYQDYYLATGRDPDAVLADSVAEAIARGGAEPPDWDPRPLLRAFPRELWTGDVPGGTSGASATDIESVASRVEAIIGPATDSRDKQDPDASAHSAGAATGLGP